MASGFCSAVLAVLDAFEIADSKTNPPIPSPIYIIGELSVLDAVPATEAKGLVNKFLIISPPPKLIFVENLRIDFPGALKKPMMLVSRVCQLLRNYFMKLYNY